MFINSHEEEKNITLYDQTLEKVENYKYLGVILNNKLNHDIHWDKVSKTTNSQNRGYIYNKIHLAARYIK
jgi:hypothetical protein